MAVSLDAEKGKKRGFICRQVLHLVIMFQIIDEVKIYKVITDIGRLRLCCNLTGFEE